MNAIVATMHQIAGFLTYTLNFSGGDTPRPLQPPPAVHGRRKPRQCLDPDTNFSLARQRSQCGCFTKQPLVPSHKWAANTNTHATYVTHQPSYVQMLAISHQR